MKNVTYSFVDAGTAGSAEFETISEAIAAAVADARAKLADPQHPIEPVSVDDHEGNVYDAQVIGRMVSPVGPRQDF